MLGLVLFDGLVRFRRQLQEEPQTQAPQQLLLPDANKCSRNIGSISRSLTPLRNRLQQPLQQISFIFFPLLLRPPHTPSAAPSTSSGILPAVFNTPRSSPAVASCVVTQQGLDSSLAAVTVTTPSLQLEPSPTMPCTKLYCDLSSCTCAPARKQPTCTIGAALIITGAAQKARTKTTSVNSALAKWASHAFGAGFEPSILLSKLLNTWHKYEQHLDCLPPQETTATLGELLGELSCPELLSVSDAPSQLAATLHTIRTAVTTNSLNSAFRAWRGVVASTRAGDAAAAATPVSAVEAPQPATPAAAACSSDGEGNEGSAGQHAAGDDDGASADVSGASSGSLWTASTADLSSEEEDDATSSFAGLLARLQLVVEGEDDADGACMLEEAIGQLQKKKKELLARSASEC